MPGEIRLFKSGAKAWLEYDGVLLCAIHDGGPYSIVMHIQPGCTRIVIDDQEIYVEDTPC